MKWVPRLRIGRELPPLILTMFFDTGSRTLLRVIRFLAVLAVAVCGGKNAQAGIISGSNDLGAIWYIGDSITQSNADGDANGSPRLSLYDDLNAGGYTFSFTGHTNVNIDGLPATGGTSATNLYQFHSGISGAVIQNDGSGRTGIAQNLPTWWTQGRLASVKPNVILIMIGTNDVDIQLDLPNAPSRLGSLINTIYALPGIGLPSIFVATIPPNRTNTPGDPINVSAFNAALPSLINGFRTAGKDVTLVDQYTPLNNSYATDMRPDNLHPNSVGNDIISQQWYQAIQARAVPEPSVVGLLGVASMVLLRLRLRRGPTL